MLIPINDYRRANNVDVKEPFEDQRRCGNTVPVPRVRPRAYGACDAASPQLPDDFADFHAKNFIERAYGLATQI